MHRLVYFGVLALCVASPAGASQPSQAPSARPVPHPTPISLVRGFGMATVLRHSSNSENGFEVSPWTSVTIGNVFTVGWKQGPVVGTRMTVIPLGVDLAPVSLEIVKAEYAADPCADNLPWTWTIELAPVTSRAYFEARPIAGRRDDVPFDVAVVYPEHARARAVNAQRIPRSKLPPNATAGTVRAAIALHGDGVVDIIEVEFCCGAPSKSTTAGCDYTCSRTYERVHGRWRLIASSGPC